MFECLILGDSIAQGVFSRSPECHGQTTIGINSAAFNNSFVEHVDADQVLISLGSNDHAGVDTHNALFSLRQKITARQVTWLLSANNSHSAQIAKSIAAIFGDRVMEVKAYVGPDRVHPSPLGYDRMSQRWRQN